MDLNLLQLNICGLKRKKTELAKILSEKNVHVALLQETQHQSIDLQITGYTSYACTCTDCRGIVTYVRNDLTAEVTHLPANSPTDIQKCTLWLRGKKYKIYNVYSPPKTTCRIDDLQDTIYHNTILAGDFNGHSPLWGYRDTDDTGRYLEELCTTTNLSIQQDEHSTPTLLHRAHNTLTRPDLTLMSPDLETDYVEQVLPCIGSDHRPILTTIRQSKEAHERQRPRWNFRKADWEGYRKRTEEDFESASLDKDDINGMESLFTSTILKSAQLHIPRGTHKKYKPFWNAEIEAAVTSRQQARQSLESSPTPEKKTAYNRATAIAKRAVATAKKQKWTDTCSSLDLRKDGAKAWKLLNNLSGSKRKTNTRPIEEDETPQKRAETFNKFFASINRLSKDQVKDPPLLKELKTLEKSTPTAPLLEELFTMQELEEALKKLKTRKSPGPDKVHNEMLQHLGCAGKTSLLCPHSAYLKERKGP